MTDRSEARPDTKSVHDIVSKGLPKSLVRTLADLSYAPEGVAEIVLRELAPGSSAAMRAYGLAEGYGDKLELTPRGHAAVEAAGALIGDPSAGVVRRASTLEEFQRRLREVPENEQVTA